MEPLDLNHLKQKRGRVQLLTISKIRRDFQDESCLFDFKVDALVVAFRERKPIEPIRVFFDGTTYLLADGFHRVAAALKVGRRRIKAEVVMGTYADMEAEWLVGLSALKQDWAKDQTRP
jgi:uncharacterized protein (DUF1015 family)